MMMKRLISRLVSVLLFASSCAAAAGCGDVGDGSVEQEAPVASGTLSVVVTTDNKVSYLLKQDDDLLVRLNVDGMREARFPGSDEVIEWRTAGGTPVLVFGRKSADGSIDVDQLQIPGAAEGLAEAKSELQTLGTQRALVMEITFDGGSMLSSDADIKSKFATVAAGLNASSFGQFTLQSDFVGPYNIAFGSCDNYDTWVNDAKAIAKQKGIVLSNYKYFSLVVPANCGYGGMGEQPGSITWIAQVHAGVIAHELGHNFGNWHASSRTCTSNGATVPMSDTCTMAEYGDPFDMMGNAGGFHEYNANYKAALGWIPTSRVVTASGDQTYTLVPENQSGTGTQLLRINGANGVVYNVDFRQSTTTDKYSATDPAVKGVLIRAQFTAASDRERMQLLDMVPSTSTFADASLIAGKSYTFFGTTTTIQVLSVSATGAQVQVTGAVAATGKTFKVSFSGKCLSTANGSLATDADAVQRTCDGGADQKWKAVALSDGTYNIINGASNKCLDLYNGSTADGARIEQWDCWGGAAQKWNIIVNSNGTSTIKAATTGKCLDDYANSTANEAPMRQWTCNGGTNQQFIVQ